MIRTIVATLTASALLVSCTATTDPPDVTAEPSDRTAEPSDGTTSPSTGPEVDQAGLRSAKLELLRRGSGAYLVEASLSPGQSIRHEGEYQLPQGYRTRSTSSGLIFDAIVIGEKSWSAVDNGKGQTCWIYMTSRSLKGAGLQVPPGASRAVPAVIATASFLRANREGVVTSDLYSVLTMFSAEVPERLGLGIESTARVEVEVELTDGRLVGFTILGPQLVAAGMEAGLDPGLLASIEDGAAIEATFDDLGKQLRLTPPPPAFTVGLSRSRSEYEAEQRACTQRLAESS